MKSKAAESGATVSKQAHVADLQLQEPTEEEREQREAEFEEQLRMRVVRSNLIGRDRHFRRYWWLQGRTSDISWLPTAAVCPLHKSCHPSQTEIGHRCMTALKTAQLPITGRLILRWLHGHLVYVR